MHKTQGEQLKMGKNIQVVGKVDATCRQGHREYQSNVCHYTEERTCSSRARLNWYFLKLCCCI